MAQPGLSGFHKQTESLRIVFRFQHPEKSGAILVAIQMKLVYLGADSPHGVVPAVGDPGIVGGMLEIGVFGGQLGASFQNQGRNPHGVVLIQRP